MAALLDCYDYPHYWDLAFQSETKLEADFFTAALARYGRAGGGRVLEPGCGGGRLVEAMARRGYQLTAYDLNRRALRYVRHRLQRAGLSAELAWGDMTRYAAPPQFELAYCTFNTFRYLLDEASARCHLQRVAASLLPGGLYIVGLHLIPLDADESCTERWTSTFGSLKLTMTLRVVDFQRRARREVLRFRLRVRRGSWDLRLGRDDELRLYTARQFRRLLAGVPEFELCDVFDFWYDIDEPLTLNDDISDTVAVLRRRG